MKLFCLTPGNFAEKRCLKLAQHYAKFWHAQKTEFPYIVTEDCLLHVCGFLCAIKGWVIVYRACINVSIDWPTYLYLFLVERWFNILSYGRLEMVFSPSSSPYDITGPLFHSLIQSPPDRGKRSGHKASIFRFT